MTEGEQAAQVAVAASALDEKEQASEVGGDVGADDGADAGGERGLRAG
jgi:hypothetical protein